MAESPRLAVLALPLAPEGMTPDERIVGRRLAARFARKLSDAEVRAGVELAAVEADGEPGWLVPEHAPTDIELAAAGTTRDAAFVLGGAVALHDGGSASLVIRIVDVPSRRAVIQCAVKNAGGEAWMQAARDVLTELFERLGVLRGLRAPLVERGISLEGFVAIARAEDLDAARALGMSVPPEALLESWTAALSAAPVSADARQMLLGVALELGLAREATPATKSAALAGLEVAAGLDADDPRPRIAAGEISLSRGDAGRAQASALRVLARDPGHALAHSLAGRAASLLHDEATAQRHFARYALLAPPGGRRAADLEVARWWLAAGRAEVANGLFAELNQLQPLEVHGLLGLAESLLALERRAESARTARIALVLSEAGSAEQRRAQAILEFIEAPPAPKGPG